MKRAISFALSLSAALQWLMAADRPDRVCATCHPKETVRYLATAMGRSLVSPDPLPSGKVTHAASGSVISIEERDGRMLHTLSEGGLTAQYAIAYQIGGGLMARTYMMQIADTLLESPATWFNSYGWDLSPGYAQKPFIDFDRVMDEQCLFCHAGGARFADRDGHRLKDAARVLTSITCERCHGRSEAHVQHPSSNNIVNPAKLKGAARDSICEQCHLEGTTRILNPGKSWVDFHAGQPAEDTFSTYVVSGDSGKDVIAVSQTEELAQSKCARGSAGKLWCGSCHNPHSSAVDRQREIRAVCTSCHVSLSAAAHPAGMATAECTSCHMPRSSTTDIPHAALTDHRILRRPSESANASSEPPKVIAWREPSAEVRDRDFALAEVLIGFSKGLDAIGQDGFRRLESMPAEKRREDPSVLSDLEGKALQQGNTGEALRLGRRTVELQPESAKAAMNFGIVLKRSGDLPEAERQLTRAIELDPSLRQAYMELASLYGSQGRNEQMGATIDRYLRWNPQDILFRLQRRRLEQ